MWCVDADSLHHFAPVTEALQINAFSLEKNVLGALKLNGVAPGQVVSTSACWQKALQHMAAVKGEGTNDEPVIHGSSSPLPVLLHTA